MEKVEVDPKLFVTCRLCLDDMGMYQIIPNIQHQIKYCFDIDVAPFDGLPQLICKKCEEKLSEYFRTKTSYVTKQQFLINKLQSKNPKNDNTELPKIATLVSSQVQAERQTEDVKQLQVEKSNTIAENKKDDTSTPPNDAQKTVKKRRRIESSSSESSVSKNTEAIVKPLILRKKRSRTRRRWHTTDYNKYFSCRVCNKYYVKKDYFFKHYKNMHSACLKRYSPILNTFCSVKIEKVDNKPNFTGVSNTVVLSKDKVVVNDESSKYYVLYISKNQSSNDSQTKTNNAQSSDSSDGAEYSVTTKRRKKVRRLLSTVSTDTVVIEKKCENEKMSSSEAENNGINGLKDSSKSSAITECITLDSDSENENSSENKTADSKVGEQVDNKLIRNIIDVCHSKYIRNIALEKKKKPSYASIESQLRHKVLNLGRKIINKQGLNCTGLLRFLEYRNLGIIWLPKTCHTFSGPPVRISMTTLKKDYQRPEDSDVGWTDVPFTSNIFNMNTNSKEKSILKESNKNGVGFESLFNDIVSQTKNGNDTQNITTHEVQDERLVNSSEEQVSPWEPVKEQACLYKCDEGSSSGKLLNKNPVANPKQLPKKVIHYEIKPNKHILDNEIELLLQSETSNNESMLFSDANTEAENDLTCMPIITSTTSLASDFQKPEQESPNVVSKESTNSTNAIASTVSVPRIKVKPVSELMAENVTPNSFLINQNNMCHYDQSVPNMTQCIQQMQLQNIQPASVVPMPVSAVNNVLPENQTNNSEFVILDTVDMPNTKTHCPFLYLKTLLEVHNIILVENMTTPDYHCLLKFKVLFKQESVKPIVLCLSLHCNGNRFFIGLKDSSQVNIDMRKISANWQWEIVKIFQGDVCNKIIQNALKLGLEVHDYAKKFLCLLKAIQMKKIDGSQG